MAHAIRSAAVVSVGRTAANTIVLDSPKVSRRPRLIHLQNVGELWLIDFGSSNGTFLNKRRIHHPIRLSDGDQIIIGDQTLTLRQPVAISKGVQNRSSATNIAGDRKCSCWLVVADIRGFTPLSRSMQSEDLDVLLGSWIFTRKETVAEIFVNYPVMIFDNSLQVKITIQEEHPDPHSAWSG